MVNSMVELYADKKDCCGCGACVNICTQNAITLESDEDTFLYPTINTALCIGCNACTQVCPIKNTVNLEKTKRAYAATYKRREVLQKSSSGGIFPAVANYILSEGGVVFATSLNEVFLPCVISVKHPEELYLLQGSKYVQSNMGDCFRQILDYLKSNKNVLFCGTPCQCAAVKKYVKGYEANLYLVDIVCHGVPSVQLFHDYIKHLEQKKNIQITSYTFRDKRFGQDEYFSYTYEKNGKQAYRFNRAARSSYYKLFLKGALLRESCYHCEFASEGRVGDMSIGDYWGIEREHPTLEEQVRSEKLHGISGVLVNTAKGEMLLQQISSDLIITPSTFAQISKHNPQLFKPSVRSRDREQIFGFYHMGGYPAVDRYYYKKYRWNILKGDIGSILPLFLRKKINGFLRGNK